MSDGVSPEDVVSTAVEATGLLQKSHQLWPRAFQKWGRPTEDSGPAEMTIKSMLNSFEEAAEAKRRFLGSGSKLYDFLGKLVIEIQGLESLIDKGVALDVSGKAALPWAIIKAGLRVK